MNIFDTFRFSCCRLLEQHPLCSYRRTERSAHTLNILLIGNGARMETLIPTILTNGQLLATKLRTTVLHAGSATAENLLKRAPALGDFVRLTRDGTPLSEPAEPLAELQLYKCAMTPENLRSKLSGLEDPAYIIVSTGNDEKNLALARVCMEMLPEGKRLIACVQKCLNHGFEVLSPEPMQVIGGKQDDDYLSRLEQIAYNLHYIYAKTANDRQSPQRIRQDFEKSYNYLSNLEAALHIQSKLLCCGIDTRDPAESAAAFADAMHRDPSIVRRLAVLEHQRWIIEKLLQGYRPQMDMDQIYSRSGVTNKNTDEKWHACLLPCRADSAIPPKSWDKGTIPEDLDPLDRASIRIHRKCGELAQANRGLIQSQLESILTMLQDWPGASSEALASAEGLILLVSQLYQKNRSAIGKFQKQLGSLRREISLGAGPHVPLLLGQIDVLEFAAAPLIEYISYKNYKDQDELLVRHIPFALTHRSQCTILKLMANREMDCLLSAWQLEPKRVIYMAWAETQLELEQLLRLASHIAVAMKQGSLEIEQEYHILLSDDLMDKYDDLPLENCSAYRLGPGGTEAMMEAFADAAQDLNADYMDVTGADPAMLLAAQKYAEESGTPMIYARNGRFQSLRGAAEITYPGPRRHMMVQEMFSLSGAVVSQSDSETLSDLSKKYADFWHIVQDHPIWPIFATSCAQAYKENSKYEYTFHLPDRKEAIRRKHVAVPAYLKKLILSVMRRLQAHSVLQIQQVTHELDGVWKIEFSTHGSSLADHLLQQLQELSKYAQPGTFCQFHANESKITVTARQLSLQGLVPPPDKADEYKKLIQALAGKKIILNPELSPAIGGWSFRFGSRDILNAFQLSGKVLEYYLYYSALLECSFDDVQMGWKFNHSLQDDAANNELDVVCTQGTASLFITAKHRPLSQFENSGFMNQVCYEVSLLADRFGVNAIPVLAAPMVPMFEGDTGIPSKYMKQAIRRGVCLLGRECFEADQVAQCLSNIIDRKKNWWI